MKGVFIIPRNKSCRVYLRLSQQEKELLQKKSQKAHMNMSEYILNLSEEKKIFVVDGVPQLTLEITRIGTNINQIAYIANTSREVTPHHMSALQKQLQEIQDIMSNILHEIYDVQSKGED